MRAIRIWQSIHLLLLVAIVVLYAILKVLLPANDPDRMRINLAITVVLAGWGALVFVAVLAGKPEDSLRQRALSAYRDLLNRPVTLIASDILLGLACAGAVYLLVLFRPVEIFSVSDVDVFLDDPGTKSRRIGSVEANSTGSFRLRVGERWLAFKSMVSRDQAVSQEVGYAVRVQVPLPWSDMDPIRIPEIVSHEPLR